MQTTSPRDPALQTVQSIPPSWRTRLQAVLSEELRPAVVGRAFLSGTLLFFLQLIFVVAFASYIFAGDLEEEIGYGIGFLLVGNAVLTIIVALFSSYRGSVAGGQDVPAAILAVNAAALMTVMHNAAPEDRVATAALMIVLTSLVTGLFFWLTGRFRLGGLARFLPYPVMGGFLAGTGWMLLMGAVEVMTHAHFGPKWLTADAMLHWTPGVAFGIALLIADRRSDHPLLLPAVLAGAIGLFYLVALFGQIPLERLAEKGWLLGALPPKVAWQFPLTPEWLAHVEWGALAGQADTLAPVVVVGLIALLLNVNSLELLAHHDIDLDRELEVAGAANLAAGAVGGLIGYTFVDLTDVNESATGKEGRRLAAVIAALWLLLTVFTGAPFLPFLPSFILGGLLTFFGLTLLYEWVVEAWHRFPRTDFAIIVLILGTIALRGFLEGVALGLVATIVMFVVSYSRISVVKHAVTGEGYHSRVVRGPHQRALLEEQGRRLFILRLQGFIFFGTANHLLERVRAKVRGSDVRFVILDFAQVNGLDSTGLLSFRKMRDLARERGITLIITGAGGETLQSARIAQQFRHGGIAEEPGLFQFFPDIDHAIEWCENRLIAEAQLRQETVGLSSILPEAHLERLTRAMERLEVKPGERLIQQGADPDYLYFIESGQLTTELETPDGHHVRLETMRGSQLIGEIGFIMNAPRAASVIVDEPTVVYRLSRRGLEHMRQTDPETAFALQDVIARTLGSRAQQLLRVVEVLQQ